MAGLAAWSRSRPPPSSRPPTPTIWRRLPFDDTRDFDDADRGFIAALEPCVVTAADGRVVWDNDVYGFLTGDAPTSVHPSLWRQSTLAAKQGLYEVVEGIYQVRGLDLSNISFIEGDTGVIVIDPLISTETAAAALALYRAHRGDRPVVAVIYTHSHVDHFGGVLGVTSQADVDAGKVAVLAPEGFTEHAVQENVYAGTAMARRAAYMYGTVLARGPQGQVGCGLGQTPSTGEVALIVPTVDITRHRRDAHHRRRRDRVPDGAGHRGARRDALLLPEVPRAVHGRERHPQPAQPADAARRAGPRSARLVGLPHRGHRHLRRPRRRRVRLAPLADVGQGPRSSNSFPCNGICTPTCTTRRCASSTRASPGSRSPRPSRCRPRWRRRGTPTATTVRSATTSRPSTSATWAGSTATRAGCGRIRPRRSGRATSRRWVASTAWSRSRSRPSTTATSAGRQRFSITPSSPTRTTPAARALYADTLGAVGLRRGERDVAQLLPVRRHRVARRQLRHADADHVDVDAGAADAGADVRQLRHQRQRAAGVGSRPGAST